MVHRGDQVLSWSNNVGLARRSPERRERKDKDVAKRATVNFLYESGWTQDMIAHYLGMTQERVASLLLTSHHYTPNPLRQWKSTRRQEIYDRLSNNGRDNSEEEAS